MARLSYSAPGVYVEEVASEEKPIAGVSTSTAAFVGIVEDEIRYPVRNEDYDPVHAEASLEGPTDNTAVRQLEGKKRQTQSRIDQLAGRPELNDTDKARLEKLRAELNDLDQQIAKAQSRGAPPEALKPYKEEIFKVKVPPGVWRLCTNFSEYTARFGGFSLDEPDTPGKACHPGHRALTHAVYGFFQNGGSICFVARIRGPEELPKVLEAAESIDAVALVAAPGMTDQKSYTALKDHCAACRDRFAILDAPEVVETAEGDLDLTLLSYDRQDGVLPQRDKNAALYFPYIRCTDPAKLLQDQDPARGIELRERGLLYVAPSGHMAGIYARTDIERGVHKAPANAAVRGALGVRYYIGKSKQELLNPQGVNVIRDLNGAITVWGARTVGGDKNDEWKYVNVRRFFLFLSESIDEGTQWVVFEPNDPGLWQRIRRNLNAFLTNVWRSGALFGTSPEEAFYVKCDAELNPPEVRDLGQVIIEVGVAIVRPAEFVIFRIQQTSGRPAK